MSRKTDERTITEEDVRIEHIAEVNRPAHWAYLFAVLIGSTLLMLILIAAIAGAGS